ncbi:MAG: VOC family protein [Cyanobacteria bacterium P01_F01_bin.150]
MNMTLDLDHVFILVDPGAAVADLLVAEGFQEGSRNRHPGQGTANRRFYFANGMVEFLWVHNADEALNGPGRDLYFPERAADPKASPFGMIFLKKEDGDNIPFDSTTMPFAGWTYQAICFQPPNDFHVGINSQNIMDPLCLYSPIPFPKAPSRNPQGNTSFTISHICIHTPSDDKTGVLGAIAPVDRLSIQTAQAQHLMEITLNNHATGTTKDFRPAIPLIMHW